jgi:hypothetical protein
MAVRTFGTTTGDLPAWVDYLEALGVTHMATEPTAVLRRPVHLGKSVVTSRLHLPSSFSGSQNDALVSRCASPEHRYA